MDSLANFEIPGRVTAITGRGGLPALRIESESSVAEIYCHGAHLTGFQKKGEAPLLFMSAASEFQQGQPIRGGVPVIFPWFGGRDGLPAHGSARLVAWDLIQSEVLANGEVRLDFQLPAAGEHDPLVGLRVTVGTSLTMELSIVHNGLTDITFETCLHTYFQVGDIHQVTISGLQGTTYLDTLLGAEFTETAPTLAISAEVDRIYQDGPAEVTIHDPALGRSIRLRQSGARSTVVWNPWIAKSQRMPDFGDQEYLQMLCVETGNVKARSITLPPGGRCVLKVEIDTLPLV